MTRPLGVSVEHLVPDRNRVHANPLVVEQINCVRTQSAFPDGANTDFPSIVPAHRRRVQQWRISRSWG